MGVGGFFKSQFFRFDNDPETRQRAAAIAWGRVIEVEEMTCKDHPHIVFVIQYRQRKDKLVCEAWGLTSVTSVISAMERGDTVLVFGEYQINVFDTKKKKGQKRWTIHCNLVIPQEAISACVQMYSNPGIQKIMGEANDQADVWESDF